MEICKNCWNKYSAYGNKCQYHIYWCKSCHDKECCGHIEVDEHYCWNCCQLPRNCTCPTFGKGKFRFCYHCRKVICRKCTILTPKEYRSCHQCGFIRYHAFQILKQYEIPKEIRSIILEMTGEKYIIYFYINMLNWRHTSLFFKS